MIKIIQAETIGQHQLRLVFSDGTQGTYDFGKIIARNTVLTQALNDPVFFNAHFIELGALCWKNGLEFSPTALHRELQDMGKLTETQKAA
ncbi:MAG: hypothetical protein B7Y40_03500 [Gammaproteobacteria bacterium 28-57-27]|nr:MAG: hypothetical protein B7Y40_03500 [Gammaproteobacteria bacterium 28-57-27]